MKDLQIFKADTKENMGDNWLMATFGTSAGDGKDYILTTNSVHASELYNYMDDAKDDCERVAQLLNAYHTKRIMGSLVMHQLRVCELAHQFITNGIELGYIQMPEDKEDPAHEVVPTIEAAISRTKSVIKSTREPNDK